MREIKELDAVTLDSGVVVRCKKETTNYSSRKTSWFTFEVTNIRAHIIQTKDEKLFNLIKPGALTFLAEFFSKHSTLDVNKVDSVFLNEVDTDPIVARLSAMKDVTPVEKAFAGFFMYFYSGALKAMPDEEMIEIVRKHIRLVNEIKPGDPFDLSTVLDPFNSQLGFDKRALAYQSKFRCSDFDMFKKDPSLFKFFLQCSRAFEESLGRAKIPLSSVETDIDFGPFDDYSSTLKIFSKFPIHHAGFVKEFQKLNVDEANSAYRFIPPYVSEKLAINLLHHAANNYRNRLTVESLTQSHELYSLVFNKVISSFDSLEQVSSLCKDVMEKSAGLSGFRAAFADFICHPKNESLESAQKLLEIIGVVASFSISVSWIERDENYTHDYVLKVLHEKIGGFNAVTSIMELRKIGEALSFGQWMEFADRFDELSVVPVAWWKGLLSTDEELREAGCCE